MAEFIGDSGDQPSACQKTKAYASMPALPPKAVRDYTFAVVPGSEVVPSWVRLAWEQGDFVTPGNSISSFRV